MVDEQELRQLKQIKKELVEIKDRTGSLRRIFMNGMLYGAGAFVGGVLAVALAGWFLSFLGVIPGLSELATSLQNFLGNIPRK